MIRKSLITLSALLALATLVLMLWGSGGTAELDLTRGTGGDRIGPVFHVYDGRLLLNLHVPSAIAARWPRWDVPGVLTIGVGQAMEVVRSSPYPPGPWADDPAGPSGRFESFVFERRTMVSHHLSEPRWVVSHQILPLAFIEMRIWCLILPFLLFAAGPVVAFVRGPYRRHRRRKRGLCDTCGYNLTGNVSGMCPECGERI